MTAKSVLAKAAALGAALGAALVVLPTSAASAQSTPSSQITFAVDCVNVASNGQLSAVFEYDNMSANPITIAVGASNTVTPNSLNGEQTTTFLPGDHPGAWVSSPVSSATITWVVDGTGVLASTSSPACGGQYAFTASGNGLGLPLALAASVPLAGAALFFSRKRRQARLDAA